MNEVPTLIRAHPVTPGWHRCAVQSGHENPIEVRIRGAALEPGTRCEVMWRNKIALVIAQRWRGGAVAPPALAVTLITFQCLLLEFLPAFLRFRSVR